MTLRDLGRMLKRLFGTGRAAKPGNAAPDRAGAGLWLDGYSGQTTDELLALADTHRADSVVIAFELALIQKADRVGLPNLRTEERVVLAVEAIEREVNNGGFDQLFRNASKRYAPEFVSALEAIGCQEVAEVTERAIKALRLTGPTTTEAIDRVFERENERRDDRLDELDGEYLAVVGNLAPSVLSFIKAHRAEIVLGSQGDAPA
jgi:hypothetical protein